jgi:hypothetical protein
LLSDAHHKQSATQHRKAKPKGAAAMTAVHLNIEEAIGLQVQEIAEWRWRKAEEFPDDQRNIEAAKELERLAAAAQWFSAASSNFGIDRYRERTGGGR